MNSEARFYEQGWEEYPASGVVVSNIIMLLWIALGTIASRYVSPLAGWFYLAFALGMVYGVLRKLVCTNCYYYGKRCHLGWGKLVAWFFNQGKVENFANCTGIKLAGPTYGLLFLFPLVLLLIALFQRVTPVRLIILVFLLATSLYSSIPSRKKACRHCKMRLFCPGSAVK